MKLTKKVIEARINRAVVGFRIPMMSVPKIYARLESAIKAGMSDEYLRATVAASEGVETA